MNFLMKAIQFIHETMLEGEENPEIKTRAKLSEEEVLEIAGTRAKEEGWFEKDMVIPPTLSERLEKKLTWRVFFKDLPEDGLPVRGGHMILFIDDETGEVVKKVVGTR